MLLRAFCSDTSVPKIGRVRGADDAENPPDGVDHRDRDLGVAAERAPDLPARRERDAERLGAAAS